jgi:hypothetical protein
MPVVLKLVGRPLGTMPPRMARVVRFRARVVSVEGCQRVSGFEEEDEYVRSWRG